jgi:cell division protein FtsI/penicillin-binding protein 2
MMWKKGIKREGWRDYQARLRRELLLRNSLKRLPRVVMYLMLGLAFFTGSWLFAHLGRDDQRPSQGDSVAGKVRILVKEDLPAVLAYSDLKKTLQTDTFSIDNQGNPITVETYFDTELQQYVLKLLGRSLTHKAAVVIMRPDSGEILAMADYHREEGEENNILCLQADFPAASLFKIISAAAAIEEKRLAPDTPLYFRGRKHTLYKNQLGKEEKIGRYTNKTSLRSSFCGSINPVFGKIGIYELGRELLVKYSERFLFNQSIPFELPLEKSEIEVPENAFGLAEIASGFNKRTLISPLHAALITAVVANGGVMMAPSFVWRIIDHRGRLVYAAKREELARSISAETAQQMRILMRDTVTRGTCRSAFLPLKRKKAFRDVELGAKTGTINDPSDRYKFDWLTAYALPKGPQGGIVISVLAVHGEKLGIRSNDLARYIINHHFAG